MAPTAEQAAEIIEDLQSALEEHQAITDDLAQTPGAQEGELDELYQAISPGW